MDFLLVDYKQEKKDRKKTKSSTSKCSLKLWSKDDILTYDANFTFEYERYGVMQHITFIHGFDFNTTTGDIDLKYEIKNHLKDTDFFRNLTKSKRNNFQMLFDLSESGFFRGEKRTGFWGIKYFRIIDEIIRIILEHLKPKFKTKYLYDKISSDKSSVNNLYDMIVDFHLDMKEIKGHNGVYFDIMNDYPKKKWLEKNENKFLPAVLDYYGIKSKYLIGELNKNYGKPYNIESISYLCKLFGKNYVPYLKKIVWQLHCYDKPQNKKIHELKNDSEKNCMVDVINKWETEILKADSCVSLISKVLSIRDFLEQKGMELKFKAKNDSDFENLMEVWGGHKTHFTRGYKTRYLMPKNFIDDIEQDIIYNGKIYKSKILKTEDDFRIEGYNMKNCMSKQFIHGVIYIFVSLSQHKKRINIQYRRGRMVQAYGRANTPVKNEFEEVIEILSKRFENYPQITITKEKYDIITY